MKTMRQLMGMTCTACLIYGLPVLTHATTVTLGDGSQYEIYLESHVGNTWTYSVSEVSGKSLSHWNVGIPSCIGHITDYSPTGGYDTTDGSTSFDGIKWDVEESFTSGTFSVTLDADYPETMIEVQAKAGKPGNERTGEVKGPDCNTLSPPGSIKQPCDFVYGVHDGGLNNSQLFKVDPTTLIFEPLGPEYPGYDIEAIDISPEPNELYAASSDDTVTPGHLYKVDMGTGAITDPPQKLCVTEVDGISINPVDGTLWGWAQDEGLFRVLKGSDGELDVATCEVVVEAAGEYEDLTWDNAGTIIYAVQNVNNIGDKGSDANAPHKLLAYNVVDGSLNEVCGQVLEGKEIEALEILTNGDLLLGYDESKNKPMVAVLNPSECNITLELELANYLTRETPYKDIEGLAVCPPQVPENNDSGSSESQTGSEPQDGSGSSESQTDNNPQDGSNTTSNESESLQISLADDRGSTYEFTLVNHDPNTKEWTYRVEKLTAPEGQKDYKDLSHFSLGLGNACGFANQGGGEFGKDGSSNNFWGLKWNISGGTVTFRLSSDYEVGPIPVLAKSNTNYNTANMTGPICSNEVGGFSNDSSDSSGTLGGGSSKGGNKKPK